MLCEPYLNTAYQRDDLEHRGAFLLRVTSMKHFWLITNHAVDVLWLDELKVQMGAHGILMR